MRAMWSGAVSFGLVSVPVKLYSATTNHDVRFHQVHATDGGRIKYKRVCTVDGEEVEYADIVKGYETDDGELITLTDEDLDSLPMAAGHEIDVIEFVPSDQIDPMLFEKSYYLEPEAKAAKPYALLREALVQTDRMAVVRFALRQRESIAVLRVRDKVIVLQTMLWPDEIREPDFDILDADVELRPQEQTMAASLVESLGADFDPVAVPRRVPRRRRGDDRAEAHHGRDAARAGGDGARRRERQHDRPALRPAGQRGRGALEGRASPPRRRRAEKQAPAKRSPSGEVAQEGRRRRREAHPEAQARLISR